MEMWNDGFHDITNLDYSSVVIETMSGRTSHATGLKWVVGDVTRLSEDFAGESFDVVMEKGTLDALLVSEEDPWCYSEEAEAMLDGILRQVSCEWCGSCAMSVRQCLLGVFWWEFEDLIFNL